MEKVTFKKSNSFASALIISGAGALWLTFCWYKGNFDPEPPYFFFHNDVFAHLSVLFYYIFNSILMIILGLVLINKKFKLYSVLAIFLSLSVMLSFFVVKGNGVYVLENLFVNTMTSGMLAGAFYGGFFLVPMFLFCVCKSSIQGFQYIMGKLNYVDTEDQKQESINETKSL